MGLLTWCDVSAEKQRADLMASMQLLAMAYSFADNKIVATFAYLSHCRR